MVRPKKIRRLCLNPEITYFKPKGVPLSNLQEIDLLPEEYEAIKLVNIDELNMKQGAEQLGISPATFNRIVNGAYKKITDAIINGKAININKIK